ncbi:MAG: hypothetical protein K2P84_07325 [Undibacterium sp.]|nr:hypothetical protein [Undibacterium sp.]
MKTEIKPEETANPVSVKKSVVSGLPTVAELAAAKANFAGVAGRPNYKAKSSKATGAKKRVRQ